MMSDWLAAFGAPYGGGKLGCGGSAMVRSVGRSVGSRGGPGQKGLDDVQALGLSHGLKAQDDKDFPIDPA